MSVEHFKNMVRPPCQLLDYLYSTELKYIPSLALIGPDIDKVVPIM